MEEIEEKPKDPEVDPEILINRQLDSLSMRLLDLQSKMKSQMAQSRKVQEEFTEPTEEIKNEMKSFSEQLTQQLSSHRQTLDEKYVQISEIRNQRQEKEIRKSNIQC